MTQPVDESIDLSDQAPKGWYGTWLPRIGAATVLVIALVFGAQWVFTSTVDFLLTLLMSFFIAFALLPAVEFLAKRGWRRGVATGVVMVGGSLVGLLFGLAIMNVFIGQLIDLIQAIPAYADTVTIWLTDNLSIEIDPETFDIETEEIAVWLEDNASTLLGGVVGFASTILGFIFKMLTIGLFLFYILADMPKLRETIMKRLPPERQAVFESLTSITIDKVGGYVYSRGLLALISAAFHFVVFIALGLPYPLALALWVGVVSQFIPTIGTYLAGVVPVVVALLEDPVDALWVLIAVTLYQQVENYLVSPRVTRNTMELHPAVAFGAAIVGASLLGGVGALLALPVAAAVVAVVDTYSQHFEVIESEQFESVEAYERRMREKTEEKQRKRAESRLHPFNRSRPDDETPDDSTT